MSYEVFKHGDRARIRMSIAGFSLTRAAMDLFGEMPERVELCVDEEERTVLLRPSDSDASYKVSRQSQCSYRVGCGAFIRRWDVKTRTGYDVEARPGGIVFGPIKRRGDYSE